MLSSFCCSMTCLKWLRLLNEPLKKIIRCFYYMEALLWFSPWCFIWVDLAHAYNMFDSYKVAISLFGFWLVIPHYALVYDVLSLCMIMAVIALLVGRSKSFARLHFVLSMSSTRTSNSQKPSLPMCPPYIPIRILLFQVHFTCFYLSFKLNSFLVLCQN
jgi:hypothetical protein